MANVDPIQTTKFNMYRDLAGSPAYGPPFAYDRFGVKLTASAGQSFTVPSNFQNWEIAFSIDPGTRVFVCVNGTAAVFGGTIGTVTSELNPQVRYVNGGDVINMISPDNPYVGVTCYALPNAL